MKNKITESKIDKLIPDTLNANKHSEYGMHLLEKSISELGLGRSILLDKNNNVIGGNGVVETASMLNLNNVVIVETDGKTLIAVKRTDVDINSKIGRELAISDNSVARVNLTWDYKNLSEIKTDWDINTEEWGVQEEFKPIESENEEEEKSKSFKVTIDCCSELEQNEIYNRLKDLGYNVKI